MDHTKWKKYEKLYHEMVTEVVYISIWRHLCLCTDVVLSKGANDLFYLLNFSNIFGPHVSSVGRRGMVCFGEGLMPDDWWGLWWWGWRGRRLGGQFWWTVLWTGGLTSTTRRTPHTSFLFHLRRPGRFDTTAIHHVRIQVGVTFLKAKSHCVLWSILKGWLQILGFFDPLPTAFRKYIMTALLEPFMNPPYPMH